MGWPLAVSAGLMERSSRALVLALGPLAIGHFLAMLVVLLPFALLSALFEWQHSIRIGASVLLIAFGTFRIVNRRHPRALARIPPTKLGLWSFGVAIAHGAGFMLLSIYLGLCRTGAGEQGQHAAICLMNGNVTVAILVSVVHGAAMIAAGGAFAIQARSSGGFDVFHDVQTSKGRDHCFGVGDTSGDERTHQRA